MTITVILPGLVPLRNEISDVGPYLTNISGWTDSTETVWDFEQRPAGVGYFDDDYPEERGRDIGVSAVIDALGVDVYAIRRQVMMLKSLGKFPVTVIDGSGTFTAEVKVDGRIAFNVFDERGIADFDIPLTAIDPRKYGPTLTPSTGLFVSSGGVLEPLTEPLSDGTEGEAGSSGRVTLTNTGTSDTIPEFTVRGGMTEGFELIAIEKGARIRFERNIPSDTSVRVEMATGQAWIGDSPVSGDITIGEWWKLLPGETVNVQFVALGTTSGTPTLTARYASADR